MKRLLPRLGDGLLTLVLAGIIATLIFLAFPPPRAAHAQVSPSNFVQTSQICTSSGTTGTFTATPGVSANKVYEIAGAVGTGTGSLTIAVEGHVASTTWSTIGTTTLSLTPSTSVGIISSSDRFSQVRCNITAFTGTTPTATVTMGY